MRSLLGLVAAAALASGCTTRPAPVEFTCFAHQPWQNTGILVRAGDHVTIGYETGQWTADIRAGLAPPAGNTRTPGRPGDVVPAAPRSTLIGRVADRMFVIGNEYDGVMPVDGRLYCVINTDITESDAGPFLWADGSVTMRVLVTHPAPACGVETPQGCL